MSNTCEAEQNIISKLTLANVVAKVNEENLDFETLLKHLEDITMLDQCYPRETYMKT